MTTKKIMKVIIALLIASLLVMTFSPCVLAVKGGNKKDEGGDGGDGGEEGPTPGNYNSYYEFVFTVKLRTPYYAQFGEPGK